MMKPIRALLKGRTAAPHARQSEVDWRQLLREYEAGVTDGRRTQQLRLDFLGAVAADVTILEDEAAARFFAEQIEADDFAAFEWESTRAILVFCNLLYTFPFPDPALRALVREHIHVLFRQVLQTYETTEDYEQLFTGVQVMPTFAPWDDEELKRLRHLAYRYEYRRVNRNRRILYAYLLVQLVLVVLVFPNLMINAENGALQAQVEQLANVEIGDEGYQLLSYTDALYWAIITATSIGYGDITPVTTTGRIIAAILGVMGVVTIGIVTGLIMDWITPRNLD
jgi:hypothetical protein